MRIKQILSTILCAGIIGLIGAVTGIGSLEAKAVSVVYITMPNVRLTAGNTFPSAPEILTNNNRGQVRSTSEWYFADTDTPCGETYVRYNTEYVLKYRLVPYEGSTFDTQTISVEDFTPYEDFPSNHILSYSSNEIIIEFRYDMYFNTLRYETFKTAPATTKSFTYEKGDIFVEHDSDVNGIISELNSDLTATFTTDENSVNTGGLYDDNFIKKEVIGTINWDTSGLTRENLYYGNASNDANLKAHDFIVRGTVENIRYADGSGSVEDGKITNNLSVNVQRTIKIGRAAQVETPYATQAPGTHYVDDLNGNWTVDLKTETDGATIYYAVGTEKEISRITKPTDYSGWEEYKPGTPITLNVGAGKEATYAIKAYALKEYLFDSPVCEMYTYTLQRRPDDFKGLDGVDITIDEPVGGEPLPSVATTKKWGVSGCSVSWNPDSSIARFNTDYTVRIRVMPDTDFYFLSNNLNVTVNGRIATWDRSPYEDDKWIIVYYTFTTPKAVVSEISPQTRAFSFESGTTTNSILSTIRSEYGTVSIKSNDETVTSLPVTWNTDGLSSYNPYSTSEWTGTLRGTVQVPSSMNTAAGVSKNVTAVITVTEAGVTATPYVAGWGYESGSTFEESVTIQLACGTDGAKIYYTLTDVTSGAAAQNPTVASSLYSSGIKLPGVKGKSVTYEIRAIAMANAKKASEVLVLRYTIVLEPEQVGPVSSTLKTNTESTAFDEIQYTELYCNLHPDALIYYTVTIGSGNESSPILYDGLRIAVAGAQGAKVPVIIRAYARKDGMKDSEITTFIYWVDRTTEPVADPTVDVVPGTYTTNLSVKLSCETPGAVIRYTLDGRDPLTNGLVFNSGNANAFIDINAPVGVKTTVKLRAVATKAGMDNSQIVEFTYTLEIPSPGPAVTRIEIVTRPLKYNYTKGASLNVAGGKIKVTYSDGKEEIIDMTEDMVYGFDSWQVGVQTLIVEYGGKRDAFNVRVQGSGSSSGGGTGGGGTTAKPDDDTEQPPELDDTTDSDLGDNIPRLSGTTAAGWAKIIARLAEMEYGSRVIITLNGATSVPAEVFNTAAMRNLILEIRVNGTISWTVDTSFMSSAAANMSAGVNTNSIYMPQVLVDAAGEKELVRFHVGENKLGALLNFRGAEKGKFANLFKYNSKTQELEFVDVTKVGSNGIATITPTSVGDYIIILDAETKMLGDIDNSTKLNALDASALLKMLVNSQTISAKGDINRDGRINALDASYILKKCVGIVR